MSDKAKFIFRVVIAVVTGLIVLSMVGLTIFAATIPHWGMFASCLLLALMFGFMSVHDIRFFLSRKTSDTSEVK